MINSAVVSTRSRIGSPSMFSPYIHRIDVVEGNGGLINVQDLTGLQRLLYRNADMYSIVMERQKLVFRHKLTTTHGRRVEAKLTMEVSVERSSLGSFLNAFYHHTGRREITTGLLIATLRPHVQAAIAENLSFVDVSRVPLASPIKNANRHNKLKAICKSMGIHLFIDELTLESVY